MRLEVASSSRYRAALQQVLDSATFRDAPTQRKLLTWLAERAFEGRGQDLKEYSIGIELFGKPESYSPQSDPSVRVQAGRLRTKLEDYYRTEGAEADIVIRLPKGTFTLVFEPRVMKAEPAAVGTVAPPAIPADRRQIRLMWIALALCALAGLWQTIANLQARSELRHRAADPAVTRLWQPVLASSRPLLIVLGTPVMLNLGDGNYRNSRVNSQQDVESDASLKALLERMQVPRTRIWYPFTGVGEAIGAYDLGRLFEQAQKPVILARSNALSWDEAASHDLVILGSAKSNPHLRELPFPTAYRLVPGGIQVSQPLAGEPSRYSPEGDGQGNVISDYVLVARLPGLNGAGYLTAIAADSTAGNWAGAEALTEPQMARTLIERMSPLPEFFEAILKAEIKDGRPVKIEYVRHRAFTR